MVDNRTNYARDISMMVYDTYSATVKVFATEIPMSVRASEVSHEVIAYQIRQSFKPGEITPEEANRLGHELALRFTKGKYALSWLRTRIELMCIIISFLIPHPLMPPGSSKTSGCPALPCSVSVI